MDVDQARRLAGDLLSGPLERRWRHVQAVACRAASVTDPLGLPREVLVSAAWLHDIGYAPSIVDTGFHPLDGARFLRGRGVDELVVALVAHHSCAKVEAELRGLDGELLAEFPEPSEHASDAMCFCDMTVGPSGQPVTVDERLAEIRVRYGPDHVVTRFVEQAEPQIRVAARRVEHRLLASGASIDVRVLAG